MKRARRIFLLVLASLSLSGCGGSRELTFKEVEEKMEYVLMSEDVKISNLQMLMENLTLLLQRRQIK